MKPIAFKASLLNIFGNTALFAIKIAAGLMSGSIALLSDAMNSLNDIAASIATFICMKVSAKSADKEHPFGHARAEPIAGIIIAILAGILGFEMGRESIGRFIIPRETTIGLFALSVPVITIVVKLLMARYFRRAGTETNSPALAATAVDSMMDVVVSSAALIGIIGVKLGYPTLDPIAGIVISVWIIYTGYKIGTENIDYLMGRAPKQEIIDSIKRTAEGVAGVSGSNTLRAHYVGSLVHVEIHIEVDGGLSTHQSHEICEAVRDALLEVPQINEAFIHIDPV
jgi:cation diffusion facilitator family transporter